ncbi:MAG: NUDIX hydrolase [Syntrophales bacterium]
MGEMGAALRLLRCREDFLTRATERLGVHPSDFLAEMELTTGGGGAAPPRLAAGVLLPLIFHGSARSGDSGGGQFTFRLIKRSSRVSQPGDLSCPGGMIHPIMDRLLRPLLIHAPVPIIHGPARAHALRRGPDSFRAITLFLANALRESWEEIGLFPCRVRFLGPLPAYRLARFRRTIFPLAGFVEKPQPPRPNREVEKIVEIPLAAFFREDLIGCYTLSGPDAAATGLAEPLRYPCLIHRNPAGGEEILWGATFSIIVQFLTIVMDYQLPDWTKGPVIRRTLSAEYLNGRSASSVDPRFFLDRPHGERIASAPEEPRCAVHYGMDYEDVEKHKRSRDHQKSRRDPSVHRHGRPGGRPGA